MILMHHWLIILKTWMSFCMVNRHVMHKKFFFDASFLVALLSENDVHHKESVALISSFSHDVEYFVNEQIFFETVTCLTYK